MSIRNLINQNAHVAILAIGLLLCIITGGNVDLSVDSTVARIGAMIMGVLNIGMSLIGLPQNLQHIVKSLVLLMAVAFDVMRKNNMMAHFLLFSMEYSFR